MRNDIIGQDENISSRTRSSNDNVTLTDMTKFDYNSLASDAKPSASWKICNNMNLNNITLKPGRRSLVLRNKNKLISEIQSVLNTSRLQCEEIMNELNFLQSGNLLIHFKKSFEAPPKCDEDKLQSTNYFLTDSEDSDHEYLESDEILNRVKAEQKILERIKYMKSNDLWSQKVLTKKVDPSKPMFHWDYLLKEMKWLQSNMITEKQNKKTEARKLAAAAAKYVKEKEVKLVKLSKEETVKAKKHCSLISKMVKDWWKQMEKIVLAKHKFRLDARRQEAMNTHLDKVLETTEKYTEWLTEDLKVGNTSCNSSSVDSEFQLEEENIESEECSLDETDVEESTIKEEVQCLCLENEKPLDDILNELPEDYLNVITGEKIEHKDKNYEENSSNLNPDNSSSEKEYTVSEVSEDDEDTMKEQEEHDAQVRQSEEENEIDELHKDAKLPIDQLVDRYEDYFVKVEVDNEEEQGSDDSESVSEYSESSKESTSDDSVDLESFFKPEEKELKNETSEFQGQFQEIANLALSTQPKGFTLESTDVKVQIPFLLKHSLREYQHVGLDWLAAIYEKRLNGVLADEMGLGKTIQTIALLAYMACEKSIWGPNLVIVPTSVILNWEIEFKKWCPSFKILTYFGNLKERKEKRKGWTKPNAFHICITSYKLAIQDSGAFKRKKWKYMILDEAQNIKNFKSQRWQTLLTFNSQRRLLLTGTPLQNNLMELWSLLHFLMPNIFQSHREFNEWFGNPLSGMIEGGNEYNEQLIFRLHKVLRPFILRRLKKDVEKQLPSKIEHVVMCPLSKRQRFLYDDYMSLTSTKETLNNGQFMSIINILMQLRKVCNHPNLFEERPVISPFIMTEALEYNFPKMCLIEDVYENSQCNGKSVLLGCTSSLVEMADNLPQFVSERIRGLIPKPNLIEEVDSIETMDWVGKFQEKYGGGTEIPFIPKHLNDYLIKVEDNSFNMQPPKPVVFGLKIRNVDVKRDSELPEVILDKRTKQRNDVLKLLRIRNTFNCMQCPYLGPDIIYTCTVISKPSSTLHVSYEFVRGKSWEKYFSDGFEFIQKAICITPQVIAAPVKLKTSAILLKKNVEGLNSKFIDLYRQIPPIVSKIQQCRLVQFPETRLIEYDCGKLQVLVNMLQRLKSEGHRCLIFTQMTRMLDVLEQFLSYHGYRYLRLDGTTKVEQRQMLMERFNKDEKIFVFILSTRSGGVGVNLTGADTVIFYDSDWNPTMDAQAQDRCHRIGQTRDVHIYRLISSMTVEENILKKANEKRCLSEMAIEGGQFNMTYFKGNTLSDIFQNPTGLEDLSKFQKEKFDIPSIEVEETSTKNNLYKSRKGRTIKWRGDKSLCTMMDINNSSNNQGNSYDLDQVELEAALEQVEEESDRIAAKNIRAETTAEMAEFDESVPWEDANNNEESVMTSEADKFRIEMEMQLANLDSQLDPLQRYGVNWLEANCVDYLDVELQNEETQIESSKHEWELEQMKALHEDEEQMRHMEEDDMMYIYGDYDPTAAQRLELEKLRQEELMELEERRREEEFQKNKSLTQNLKRKFDLNDDDKEENGAAKLKKFNDSGLDYSEDSTFSDFRKLDDINVAINYDISNSFGPSSSSSNGANLNRDFTPRFPQRRRGRRPKSSGRKLNISTDTTFPNIQKVDRRISRGKGPSESSNENSSNENVDPDQLNISSSSLVGECGGGAEMTKVSSAARIYQLHKYLPTSNRGGRRGRPPKVTTAEDISAVSNNITDLAEPMETASYLPLPKYSNGITNPIQRNNLQRLQQPITGDSGMKVVRLQSINQLHGPNTVSVKEADRISDCYSYTSRSNNVDSISCSTVNTGAGPQNQKRPVQIVPVSYPHSSTGTVSSTSMGTSSAASNNFKIPVKTLDGDHKLFSASKLLMKTKPVFVISRQIEDDKGAVYTQNLTYPVTCGSRFNQISGQLKNLSDNTPRSSNVTSNGFVGGSNVTYGALNNQTSYNNFYNTPSNRLIIRNKNGQILPYRTQEIKRGNGPFRGALRRN